MIPLARVFKHWFTAPQAVARAFPPATLDRIQAAIAQAESQHSGEIRFAVEGSLPWSYLRRDAAPRERAWMVFSKLRVWDTEHNNGVLIYVELADHDVEIVADRGLARRITQAQWQLIANAMRESFRAGEFEAGSLAAIAAVGDLLAAEFPLTTGISNPNELSNRPALL
ncbi:MAG: TPM domain-containing protein [Burkholderiaceae bacterium]